MLIGTLLPSVILYIGNCCPEGIYFLCSIANPEGEAEATKECHEGIFKKLPLYKIRLGIQCHYIMIKQVIQNLTTG